MAARKGDNRTQATATNERAPQPTMGESGKKIEVIVIGDVYWDSVVVPFPFEQVEPEHPGNDNTYVRIDRRAGAWLLERLIVHAKDLLVEKEHIDVKGYIKSLPGVAEKPPRDALSADKWGRALTVVKLFPKGVGSDMEERVYRIADAYGWVRRTGLPKPDPYPPPKQPKDIPEQYKGVFKELNELVTPKEDNTAERILVINDDNHIFRHLDTSVEVLRKITASGRCWLILAMEEPLADDKSKIWNLIKENEGLLERTTVVVSAAALRFHGLNIRQRGSIETTAYDLVQHGQPGTVLDKLMKCQHVLVRDIDGVYHFNIASKERFDYYFRPFEAGPEYNPSRYGSMSGDEKILIASIVKEMLRQFPTRSNDRNPFSGIPEGIRSGVRRWAMHFEKGFSTPKSLDDYLDDVEHRHPFDHLFSPKEQYLFSPQEKNTQSDGESEKKGKIPPLAWVQFPFPLNTLEIWSRVAWFLEHRSLVSEQTFVDFLADVVKKGLQKAIRTYNSDKTDVEYIPISCPFARIGELEVVDRDEIDRFIDIYMIIQKYLDDNTWKTPLSLAVFGPPGTGKSFTVGQILKAARSSSARAGKSEDALVYNLAEFTTPANLTIAFHQAQDRALSEEVPMIFFDEFDANLDGQRYGWLKYFLAPMQDGKFKGADTEGSYTVGKAIFVFAGGTAETFNDFKMAASSEDTMVKNAKVKDFISRLRAYLNIKGIDKNEAENSVSDLLALRRAIFLRSILNRKANQIFDDLKHARIDNRLINAFLRVERYEHGIRSMDAIVEMSRPEKGHLRVGSLPSPDQLRMHVDVERFLSLAKPQPSSQ